MKKTFALLAVLFLLLPSIPLNLTLVSASPDGDRWAVVIGISDYLGTACDLDYCDDDAIDIKNALIQYCGFPEENIKLLTDSDATKKAIKGSITRWLDKNEGPNDLVVISFSGHGTYDDDIRPIDEEDQYDEYILPHDFPKGPRYWIRDDEFGDWVGELESKKIVLVFDSCFAGGMAKGIEGMEPRVIPKPKVYPKDGFSRDIADDPSLAGRAVVLMACGEDEVSYEWRWRKNGVFTYYVVKGLAGPADGAGPYDKDGIISAEEDFAYADLKVWGRQNPEIYDGVEGEVYLTVPTASPPPP